MIFLLGISMLSRDFNLSSHNVLAGGWVNHQWILLKWEHTGVYMAQHSSKNWLVVSKTNNLYNLVIWCRLIYCHMQHFKSDHIYQPQPWFNVRVTNTNAWHKCIKIHSDITSHTPKAHKHSYSRHLIRRSTHCRRGNPETTWPLGYRLETLYYSTWGNTQQLQRGMNW